MEFIDQLRTLKDQLSFSDTIKDIDYEQIVLAGVGGSGIACKIFQELYTDKQVSLVDDYRIPQFINSKTLFIAVSFSGGTEEVITATEKAKEKGARIATISVGGPLSKYGDENILIPRNDIQPRAAIGYLLVPLLLSFGVTNRSELNEARKLLDSLDKDNRDCEKYAREISDGNHIPIIYGSSPYRAVAYSWKVRFNETSKVLSYANYFPELNHTDTMPLARTYRKSMFYFFVLESEFQEIKKRVELTASITNTKFRLIRAKGKSVTERIFYLIHVGDYISYHLAMQRGQNPSDVGLIARLKAGLMGKNYGLSQTKLKKDQSSRT